ncbi:glycosyltransferase [Flexivirga sp. ID2601S]|uniref:Glycosyltransferase n=1 Tax=Flexivirga aerilata TaxID=1656889 RepID=A0A849ALK2_9MICO|nr:glycosyltransferase [Flexivirga aerilata]NNG40188.1 glycosyltransferase [Flexivirga aerilata]
MAQPSVSAPSTVRRLGSKPRLSVVVPFYGVENYIGDCLESIRVQHLSDIEVIMVDDGSPDGSRSVAEAYAAQDPRFRVVTRENGGLGPARNTGTEHAAGEYLTFVDSDDLVTRHGFSRMIEALDTTGSSFVGGNARRFNNSSGVKPSWAQLHAFARTRFATHVFDHPVLARDRMVWNKVYRRDFWDEFGYEFPAIRYEDYPVTLKAHLDAVTVDILSQPVYYWRERESGDSITQQVFRYDNLLDRVRSASMVVDLVAAAPKPVRLRTHVMLAESDFVSIVQAFATATEDECYQLIDLGHELVERLGIDALQQRTRYDQLQYHAMLARDVELLRELAVFRRDGGLRGGARAFKVPRSLGRYEYAYPGHGRSYLPKDVFLSPAKDLALRTTVNAVRWEDDGLHVRAVAEVRHLPTGADSSLRVFAVSSAIREQVPVRRFEDVDSHGQLAYCGFEMVIDRATLARWGAAEAPVRFDLQLSSGGARRNGLLRGLRPGSATFPEGGFLTDQLWVQPSSNRSGELLLSWHVAPWTITAGEVDGDDLVLTARAPRPLQVAQFVLPGNRYAEDLRYPATCRIDGGATHLIGRIPLSEVAARTDDDDPFLRITTRGIQVRAGGKHHPLLWDAGRRSVISRVGDNQFRLTRSAAGYANLWESAVRLVADSAELDGPDLVVRGRSLAADGDWVLSWRRYLPGTEDYVEVAATSVTGTDWTVRVPVADLLDVEGVPHEVDPLASLVTWTLFSTSAENDLSTAVLPETLLVSRLPLVCTGDRRRGTLRPHGDTLQVDVRFDVPATAARAPQSGGK